MTTTQQQPTPATTPAATPAAVPAAVPAGTAGVVEAARLLLAQMGIDPADLLTGAPVTPARPVAPTIAEYVAVLMEVRPPGFAVYRHYWKRIAVKWGGRRLDEPSVSDIQRFVSEMQSVDVVRSRKNFRSGHSAKLHAISAFRSMYRHAENDGLIRTEQNPARRVHRPRQLPSTRRALPDQRLAEINEIIGATGNDPALDSLIQRLHVETACRCGGALALRAVDLDQQQCLIRLREKGNTTRWQPVSPTLMRHLVAHAEERGGAADPHGRLLRYRKGRPISQRRYSYIWERVGKRLPWVAAQGVTAHWLRHTTITWVERNFGAAVARAYAGHAENGGSDSGTTSVYTKATLGEVAAALAALTGEPHPLADAVEAIASEEGPPMTA